MKGDTQKTLLITMGIVLALLASYILFEALNTDKTEEETKRINCENACVTEFITGEPNIYGCVCDAGQEGV